jgi:TRAP-type C4-dicarboxylate transport system permease large subunit
MAAMVERRRALKWFASAGTSAIFAGCSGSGIARSDIRASFVSSTTLAGGVQEPIMLTLVNVNATCATLIGLAT